MVKHRTFLKNSTTLCPRCGGLRINKRGRSHCKACAKINTAKYYKAHREKLKAISRKRCPIYYRKNKKRIQAYKRKWWIERQKKLSQMDKFTNETSGKKIRNGIIEILNSKSRILDLFEG